MNDNILKKVEIFIRRTLIKVIGKIFHRNSLYNDNIDFNSCKFLFIRQDRIGDVLISTPLFEILKSNYPNAVIDVLLSDKNYFVVENDPNINKRWIYNKNIFDTIKLIKNIRSNKYDFAIDLMDNPSTTSTLFCLFSNAQWNVGIEKDNQYIYDIVVPMLSRRDTHIVERIAQLLVPFKIVANKYDLSVRYYTNKNSDEYVDDFLSRNKIDKLPIIGVNISAGSDVRFWGVEKYKELFNFIQKSYPSFKLMLLYQPSDIERAKEIAQSNTNIILSPITSTFDQFASFIKKLTLLITPDTSAVHLASAFKIPAVVLYVQSNKSLRIWEPYKVESECIVTNVDDLSTITLTQVTDAVERLIKRVSLNNVHN